MKTFIAPNFDLRETLFSAQFFYFKEIKGWFYIVNGNQIFKIKQENKTLFYEGIEENELIEFFSLDFNYEIFKKKVTDENIKKAIEKFPGIRLIKADFWQTLISFVCSSAANFSKIRMNIELLAEFFGRRVIFDDREFFLFPEIREINNLDFIIQAKTGYRAKYILAINQKPFEFFEDFFDLDYKQAKQKLMELSGIGSKVADCICLFGLGHKNSFPVDTWIKKAIETLYFNGNEMNVKKIEEFVQKRFEYEKGLQQQYLFHFMRNQ